MDLEKRIAQLSPANLALLEQKLRMGKAESRPKSQPASARGWPEVLPVHGRFERHTGETPDATAVKLGDAALTYQELSRRANGIAQWLRRQGIDRGSIVGICPPRSAEMVTGLLGIRKAGVACLPFEPDFPEERVASMLNDARVGHGSTTSRCLHLLSKQRVHATALDKLELDKDDGDDSAPPLRLSPSDLAYVLFTSCSRGQPKGAMVSHGAIDHRLRCSQEVYHLGPGDRVLRETPYTFDVIGRPISNPQTSILNERLQPSPIGDGEPWLDESGMAGPEAIV